MRRKPMRLGVLAVLLLVISVCLATLAVLTISTSQADLRLAERYADTTRQQYQREQAGQTFLREAEQALEAGVPLDTLDGVTESEGVYEKTISLGNAALHVGIRPEETGGLTVVRWETDAQWVPREPARRLWDG